MPSCFLVRLPFVVEAASVEQQPSDLILKSVLIKFAAVRTNNHCAKVLAEERVELVPRDQVHAIVEIDVTGAADPDQFLRLGRPLVGILAELARVRLIAGDEEHRTRRDRLDVVERVEIHELDVAGQRRVRRETGRAALGRDGGFYTTDHNSDAVRQYWVDAGELEAISKRLQNLRRSVEAAVPAAQLASDQPFRLTTLAWQRSEIPKSWRPSRQRSFRLARA